MAPLKKKAKTASSTAAVNTVSAGTNDDARGKRKRRESKGYEPDDFTMASERAAMAAKEAGVPKGRGVKLGDIPVLKARIVKIPLSHEDLSFAYNFVFGPRGKVAKVEMKEKLLEFNGYLPALPKGKVDDATMDKEEDKYEVGLCLVSQFQKQKLDCPSHSEFLMLKTFLHYDISIPFPGEVYEKGLQNEYCTNSQSLSLLSCRLRR
jgi:hypothetical protein